MMKLQPIIFSQYRRLLRFQQTKYVIYYLLLSFAIIAITSFTIFIALTYHYSSGNQILEKCFSVDDPLNAELKRSDILIQIAIQNIEFTEQSLSDEYLKLGSPQAGCLVYKNMDKRYNTTLMFSGFDILNINISNLIRYNFDNYTIVFDLASAFGKERYLTGTNQLLINELAQSKYFSHHQNIYLKYGKQKLHFKSQHHANKLWIFIKSYLQVIISSMATLYYMYAFSMLHHSLKVYDIIESIINPNDRHMLDYIQNHQPHVHLYTKLLAQKQQFRSANSISRAFAIYFFIIYEVFALSKLEDLVLIFLIQFYMIIFARTRTTIKYFPICFVILQVSYLYYCESVKYGYQNWLYSFNFFSSFSIFYLCLLKIQLPSQTVWDRTKTYTPSQIRPRCLYITSYNLQWNYEIQEAWTLLVPLSSRSRFSEQQLSLVDRNVNVLTSLMGTNYQ